MGNYFSSPSDQKIKNIVKDARITENIFEQITKNTQQIDASQTNIQKLQIKFGNITNCDVDITQNIEAKTYSNGVIGVDITSNLATSVTSNLITTTQSALSNYSGFMSTSGKNNQDIQNEINTSITEITKRTFTVENLQKLSTSVYNSQTQVLEFGNIDCTLKGQINISQDVVSLAIATAATNDLVKNLMNDITLIKIINDIKSGAGNTSSGFFESLFGSLSGLISKNQPFFIICCIIILILIIIGIYYKITKGKGGANRSSFIIANTKRN